MTSIPFRNLSRILVALSFALPIATGAFAQTPPAPEAKVDPPPAPSASPPAPQPPEASQVAPGAAKANPVPPGAAKASPVAPPAAGAGPLAPLAWLEGCWRGTVNEREFREHWMPLRGEMLIGVSETVLKGKTQDFQYLRVESRADGVYYTIFVPGQSDAAFKFAGKSAVGTGETKDEAFVFNNPAREFPKRITYRRATLGWLYVSLAGKVRGADKEVVYPMRRIDCQSGDLITR